MWQGNNPCSQMCGSEFIKNKWQAGTEKTEHGESPNPMALFWLKQMLCDN